MFKMTKINDIEMIQGDTATFIVNVDPYEINEGDKIVFTVKDLFTKEVNAEDPVEILPEDTVDKEAGIYLYDAELRTVNGEVYTVLGPRVFILDGGVSNGSTDNNS